MTLSDPLKIRPIQERIGTIYRRISYSAMRAGREPESANLLAVTKTLSCEAVGEAVYWGLRVFGENYVQEAAEKIKAVAIEYPAEHISWHLIGHLQKNKVKTAVECFDLIHTLDSIDLARILDKEAQRQNKKQRVLIQVKVSKEETKHGVAPEDLQCLVEEVLGLENLTLEGLMAIPPFFEDPEKVRPYFRQLRMIKEGLEAQGYPLKELSMGMSHDFEVAIEEGATLVRIGSAIFGDR